MALPKEKIVRILELLESGRCSDRKIALMVGCCRGSIARIKKTPAKLIRKRIEAIELPNPKAAYERCPTCGALTRPPCVACTLNDPEFKKLKKTQENRSVDVLEAFLELDLLPEDRKRYQQVRKWRVENHIPPDGDARSITRAFQEQFNADSEVKKKTQNKETRK